MELNNFKVSSSDPFFNATKWNGTLEFSRNFENMISSMLGHKFKGIYKPENNYEIGDYVWFEDACYIITNEQELKITTKQINNPIVAFKSINGFYALKDNKITNFTEYGEENKSILKADSFYYKDSKKTFYTFGNVGNFGRIYKISETGKSEALNSNLLSKVKHLAIDDFSGYVLSEEDELKKFALAEVSKSTVYEKVNFYSNYAVVHFEVDEDYIYILNNNADFLVVSKKGGVLTSTNLKNSFDNVNLVKFAVSPNKMVSFSNSNKLVFFILEKNIPKFCYTVDGEIGKIKNVTYSNKHFTYNNNSAVGFLLASKYELAPADMRNLISTSSTIEVKGAVLSLDFGRGQLVSNGETIVKPSGFKFESGSTANGVYKDGINTVQFVSNRGIQTHGNKLVYPLNNFDNMVLICEFDSATSNSEFVNVPVGEKSVKLKASTTAIQGSFKTAYEFSANEVKVTVSSKDKVIEKFVLALDGPKKNEISFEGNGSVVLSKIILISKIQKPIIDFLLNCSFVIPDYYMNDFLPTPNNNSNGVRFIKSVDRSIINTEGGIKVNFSPDYILNDSEVGLSTAGAKRLFDFIQELKNTVDNDFSLKDHKHKFSELLEVPSASIYGTKGVVSLNNSHVDINQNTAATSLAVKTVNDGVIEATRIANTKLPSASGVNSGFYLKHSANVSGDVSQVFKDGKTGMFNGPNMTNALPWGSHPYKYYFTNSHANTAGYTGILGLDFDGAEMGFTSVCNGAFKPWRRIWSSANFDPNSKSDNHSHPYLSNTGGSLVGNLKINGGYLDIAKSNGHSFIRFDAQSNDPGYILHYENANTSTMRFSVSDDRSHQDYFSWGSTPSGAYSQCAYMYTDGYFHTDGDIHSSGDITAFSDIRLKENIIPIDNATSRVEKLNGVIYDRKDNKLRQTGLIAQDVLEVIPEAVSMDEQGYYSVNYGSLVGLLVESIKELKERIEVLENK